VSTFYIIVSLVALATSIFALYCAVVSGPSISMALANALMVLINALLIMMRP
jgi:hypothetical protein